MPGHMKVNEGNGDAVSLQAKMSLGPEKQNLCTNNLLYLIYVFKIDDCVSRV